MAGAELTRAAAVLARAHTDAEHPSLVGDALALASRTSLQFAVALVAVLVAHMTSRPDIPDAQQQGTLEVAGGDVPEGTLYAYSITSSPPKLFMTSM